MAYTLFDLTNRVAAALHATRGGTATGGSATTIVDTVYRIEDDDYFNGGTAWILSTSDGLAPQGEFTVISDFVKSTATLTIGTITAVAAGDIYSVEKGRYPLWLLREKVNVALANMGTIPNTDTSLTTVYGQTEYTLPAGASLDLRRVLMQTNDDADDNEWAKILNWEVDKESGLLILPYNVPSGNTLKLIFVYPHAELFTYDDALSEYVHPDRVIYNAAADALEWYMDKIRSGDFERTLGILRNKAALAEVNHPIAPPPGKQHKILLANNIYLK